jgi:hypothetical protein
LAKQAVQQCAGVGLALVNMAVIWCFKAWTGYHHINSNGVTV